MTKEAFIIFKVEKELYHYSQRAYSIYFYLLDCFSFINQWAIIREQEEGEEFDKYDEILATTSEEHLQEKVNELK